MKNTSCFIMGLFFISSTALADIPVTGGVDPGVAPVASPTSPATAQDSQSAADPQKAAPQPYNQAMLEYLKQMQNQQKRGNKKQPMKIPDFRGFFPDLGSGTLGGENKDEYPDDFLFGSGQKGAGNIGNGLCTSQNANRSQVKNGYCKMLSDLLHDPNSCAGRAMNNIIAKGNGVAHLGEYCSTFPRMGTNKSEVFVQFLAALITAESGWNAHATEQGWYKGRKLMQGKGLFQIGVDDQSKDPDCAGLSSDTIYDAKTNIRCGACIALKFIDQDNNMGDGTGDSGARGAARYFGPLRNAQAAKSSSMKTAVNNYCVASTGGGSPGQQMALGGGSGSAR